MLIKTSPLVIGIITIIIYTITVFPEFKNLFAGFFIIYFLLAILGFILIVFLYQRESKGSRIRITFLLLIAVVLLWVGITGWFMSPFYYLLFLLAISISFIFSSAASITFIFILILIFLPNVGSIDIGLDMIMLFSLAAIIPLNYLIQKEYLKLRENEKKLIILKEKNKEYQNQAEKLLANKIVKLSMDIRQPASDIRQIASFSKGQQNNQKIKKKLDEIIKLSEQILNRIEFFENKTTGEKLIHKK